MKCGLPAVKKGDLLSTTPPTVRIEEESPVTTVILGRPAVRNAVDHGISQSPPLAEGLPTVKAEAGPGLALRRESAGEGNSSKAVLDKGAPILYNQAKRNFLRGLWPPRFMLPV